MRYCRGKEMDDYKQKPETMFDRQARVAAQYAEERRLREEADRRPTADGKRAIDPSFFNVINGVAGQNPLYEFQQKHGKFLRWLDKTSQELADGGMRDFGSYLDTIEKLAADPKNKTGLASLRYQFNMEQYLSFAIGEYVKLPKFNQAWAQWPEAPVQSLKDVCESCKRDAKSLLNASPIRLPFRK